MDDLTLFSSNHRIIQSCTKFIRVLFVRKKSNRLKPQDVTYNGQGIPSSPSVKFLGITFDSAITFRSHFHTVATLARHRLLKLNSIFSSTYGPSTSTLICLYKSYIRSLLDYGAPAICVASPNIQLSWERMKTHSFREHFPSHHSSTTTENGSTRTFHPSMTRNMYLAKRWNRRTMQHSRGVQDYIDHHTTATFAAAVLHHLN